MLLCVQELRHLYRIVGKFEIMFNLYWDVINSRVGSVLIFIALINLAQCESMKLKVREGELAQLDFPYPCDSEVVKLQNGVYARPFYRKANPHYMLLSSNQNLVNYETGLDQCFLNLTVNPVSRADGGTYILYAHKNVFMLDYPKISQNLAVDYPPGKAWCELITYYKDEEWVLMKCTAPLGTLQGQIVCYQNGTRLPPGNKLKEWGGNLNQNVLARLHGLVYCCSSILTGLKDKCDCTDWEWDPINDSISDKGDPCPQVMSTEDPTSTHSIITDSSSSNLATTQINYIENHKNDFNWIVICALSVVIFILIIIMCVILMYCCTVRKLAHQKGSITQESKEPCLSVKEENVPEHHGTII